MKKLIDYVLKFFMFIFIFAGVLLLFYGGREFYLNKIAEDEATKQAVELLENREANPMTKEQFNPIKGKPTGMLVIDKIDANLPIVEGVHEDDLRKGVGHMEGTAYPLEEDQILLSGHRDTVFTRMSEVEIGDIVTVKMPYGDFDYEVTNLRIVDQHDLTIIVPHDEETLTITTCYPFSYIGKAPDRYVVDAKPIYDKGKALDNFMKRNIKYTKDDDGNFNFWLDDEEKSFN